ncbi:uncharacterized protein B0H18DRAFT_1112612 [Fomitopsis serialis]|uniref:uncharacterized protein n=1 Tax=Fomitopsis serialis TaxID=139415 RepID=UPI0020082C38|nr:uncharacterized protein B0H18DRAFT_1112612 [Neoantrodia serialis]KAH9938456.1 hypothetical protein B0H18DRAFT_1112612 [Neoantrodia serialis]
MSHYSPQAYGVFQPQYPAYTGQNHYPTQYPTQGTLWPHTCIPCCTNETAIPASAPLSAPEIPAVTSEFASHALERLASAELSRVGFDSAEPAALQRLELEVIAFVEKLYKSTHEYANLANRAGPVAQDVLLASEEWGLQTNALHRFAMKAKKRDRRAALMDLVPPPSRSPSPELLPSDDEDTPPVIPTSLRQLPWNERYLPALPPKHTYLRTPVSPPKKAALPSLEKKLKNAGWYRSR